MTRYAAIALNVASMFLIVMAILVDSPALFYMATAVIVTLAGSRLQAFLAVRYLRFERSAPPAVKVGELVTVEVTLWSERRIKRPLVSVRDGIPARLVRIDEVPSLPVAPSFDQPIQTRYTFRPMRRGKYHWSTLTVIGTDALGLVRLEKSYATDPVELTVYPAPLPVSADIRPTTGWGASDLDSGHKRGTGLEPRGIREYTHGDPLRHVHWRSSAKRGQLMVKEFESGSGVSICFFLQRERGTEVGTDLASTLEAMCGHALFLSEVYLERGAHVLFPTEEPGDRTRGHPEVRLREVRELLTEIQADHDQSMGQDIEAFRYAVGVGGTLVVMIAVQDATVLDALTLFPDHRRVALIYDAYEYAPEDSRRGSIKSAADPLFLARIEQTGTEVIVMPRVERLG